MEASQQVVTIVVVAAGVGPALSQLYYLASYKTSTLFSVAGIAAVLVALGSRARKGCGFSLLSKVVEQSIFCKLQNN